MYLWQSCSHHAPYVLPPLRDVRVVLIKSRREGQQQWPEELWEEHNAFCYDLSAASQFLPNWSHVQFCPSSFARMHLDVNCSLRFRVHPRWRFIHYRCGVDQAAPRFPRDGTLHIHVTPIAPIKLLTFNSYHFCILHDGASRSYLDCNLVYSLLQKRIGDASFQGYNGLDFKRKNREIPREKRSV